MSKRHHSSRRRAYGRRQHELRERFDRRMRDVPTDHEDRDATITVRIDWERRLDARSMGRSLVGID